MKIAKVRMTAAAMMFMLLLGGCGDAPYELTQREQNIIVDYSAHIIAKYNKSQKEGIVYVDFESLEQQAEEIPEENTSQEPVPEDGNENISNEESGGGEDTVPQMTLTELFGREGISVDYRDAYLTSSYAEDTYHAVNADAGKIYLVMNIDITNSTQDAVNFDNLVAAPKFKITVNDTEKASSEITFLPEDFSSYGEVVESGTTKETVLLFVLPDSVTEITSFMLEVKVNGSNYQIIL